MKTIITIILIILLLLATAFVLYSFVRVGSEKDED